MRRAQEFVIKGKKLVLVQNFANEERVREDESRSFCTLQILAFLSLLLTAAACLLLSYGSFRAWFNIPKKIRENADPLKEYCHW